MPYTEVSNYQYCTGAELEDFAINDYNVTDATYTELAVMGQVSEAERWINEYCKKTFTALAAPDGVKRATLHYARYLMNLQMLEDGHIDEMPATLEDIIFICETALASHKKPIEYNPSSSFFDLRRRS